jgi:hypothetical protein
MKKQAREQRAYPRRGPEKLSLFQKYPTKSGSEYATFGPLFISATLFDLLAPYLLTLLLIIGWQISE